MGLLDTFLQKQRDKITADVATKVSKHVEGEILKAQAPTPTYMTGLTGQSTGAKRYQFSQDMINGGVQRRKKPGSDISFETLRRFSISHEISRACINLRKRQITGMEWGIGSVEDDDTGNYDKQINEVKDFFNKIGGRGIGYRRFMDRFIEDLMVLDAVTMEKQRTRNNALHTLIPIDGATIRIRVDENGATPEPPESAYVQVIRGQVTAEWTDDEMVYAMMNSRNDTPYGLAPLESLMIIITSSLKAGMYNLAYLTDGNIPEGFYSMPEGWSPQQIKDFQEYFDAMMAGNEQATRRLKFMPEGNYSPTTKPQDMAFEQFNDWLMKITCALFEVNPIDIGFNPKSGLGGKGFVEGMQQGTYDKGLLPLAMFIEEIFTKIIKEEFGYDFLKFNFPTLKEKDARGQAETNEILIRSGQRTIDELRTDDGLDNLPEDMGSTPFVNGQVTFLNQEAVSGPEDITQASQDQLPNAKVDAKNTAVQDGNAGAGGTNKNDSGRSFERVISLRSDQISELRTFRKYAINRAKDSKPARPFISSILPMAMVNELNAEVIKASELPEIRKAFDDRIKELELLNVDTALQVRGNLMGVS